VSDIKTLAAAVATLGEELQRLHGEHHALVALLLAVARTHPDPKALAAEIRRSWTLLGSRHQDEALGAGFLEGTNAILLTAVQN